MVIAGIGSAAGAFSAGLFLGAPILANLFPSLKQLQTVLVGFAGIGLGKNPNGFIQNDIHPRWKVMWKEPLSIVALIGGMAVVWLLRTTGTIANWPFVVLELGLLVLGPQLADYLQRRRTAATGTGEPRPVPLEWIGVTQPFTPNDVAEMDRELALPERAG
jgi:hypothetical protein